MSAGWTFTASQCVAPREMSAATALGQRLAVVWNNQPQDASPSLVVDVRDEQGGEVTSYTFAPAYQGRPTIASSPSGTSLLVGYATIDFAPSVQLVRIDCVGPD